MCASENQELLTGKTRLPRFAGVWTDHQVGSLGSTYGGLTGKTKSDFGVGGAKYVPFMAVMSDVLVRESSLLKVQVSPGERQNEIRSGDLLLNSSSETPDELALCAVAEGIPRRTYLNSFCIGFRLTEHGVADPHFLAYLFRSVVGRGLISLLAQGSTRYNLSKTQFRNLTLVLPPANEQRAIASVLRDVDNLIATFERLIAKKRAIKQGMMQELLTGKTRLPGFDSSWRDMKLEDLAEIVSGGTPKSSVSAYWDGGIAWCTPTDITRERSRSLQTTGRTISREGLEHSAATLLPIGALLLCTRATIGEVKIAVNPIATNQGFKSLIPRLGVSSEFLYYKVLTLREELVAKGTGSTFLEVSRRDIADLRVRIPVAEEQEAIATVLADADDEVDALRVRLAKAKAIKQGMMQELLTGRTRLPVSEDAS